MGHVHTRHGQHHHHREEPMWAHEMPQKEAPFLPIPALDLFDPDLGKGLDIDVMMFEWLFDPEVWDVVGRLAEAFASDLFSFPRSLPHDAMVSPPDQARSHGLEFEQFNVTTEDGYILDLWHVWNASCSNLNEASPVFFQHGLIDIAGTWFFNTPDKSVAYRLAANCKDIWLGNNRGTVNSWQHETLTVADKEYWNYSFHDMAMYDVPANIDFILKKTDQSQVVYVGHSQGTTQFWLANILHDDLGSKIKAMGACAPVMYIVHQNSAFVNLAIKYGIDQWLVENMDEVLWFKSGYSWIYTFINEVSPRFLEFVPRTTWMFVQAIVGYDKVSHIDVGRMPMMGRNDVGGSSTVNLKHWIQLFKTGRFASLERPGHPMVDYPVANLAKNLEGTPITLFAGLNDALSQPGDMELLLNYLPKANTTKLVSIKDYNHLDYMWAQDTNEYVADELVHFILDQN